MDRAPELPLEELLAHAVWVRRLATALIADPGAADDLVQETWVAALRRPLAAGSSPRPWLARVMTNLASNRRRAESRRAERELAAARPEALPGPEEVARELEIQRVLVEALAGLDEPVRGTIV